MAKSRKFSDLAIEKLRNPKEALIIGAILLLYSSNPITAQPTTDLLINKVIHNAHRAVPYAGIGSLKISPHELMNALKRGFKVIDTAKAYENEEMIGAVLDSFDEKDSIIVITKLFRPNLESHSILREAVLDSHKKLGKIPEFILIHGPYDDVPMISLLHEIESMKKEGLIKEWGVSNFDVEHLEILIKNGLTPALNQIEYHPFFQRPALVAFCLKYNVLIQAYRPIAQGKVLENDTLKKIAAKNNVSTANIVYSWLAQQGIAIVTKVELQGHQEEYATSKKITLSDEEMYIISALNAGEDGRTCKKGGWFIPFSEKLCKRWENTY